MAKHLAYLATALADLAGTVKTAHPPGDPANLDHAEQLLRALDMTLRPTLDSANAWPPWAPHAVAAIGALASVAGSGLATVWVHPGGGDGIR